MKTEFLIKELASKAEPVKLVSHPLIQLASWLGVAILYVSAGAILIGLRLNTEDNLTKPGFVMQFFLPLLLSLASAASAFALGIPNKKKSWPYIATLSALVICAACLFYLITSTHDPHPGAGINCIRNIIILSLPPTLLLCFLLKRAAPLQLKMAGMLAVLGSSALACAATRFICPNEDALHFFVWHFAPLLLLGAIGHCLGVALLRSYLPLDWKK